MVNLIFRLFKKALNAQLNIISFFFNKILIKAYNVKIGKKYHINGIINIDSHKTSKLKIGNNIRINSGSRFNPIGRNQKTSFILNPKSRIIIGNNVGMSSVVFFCTKEINIKDNVMIGGNVCVYDTDFHSLNKKFRNTKLDNINTISKKVTIEENVFIGAHTTILKGVTIGKNSIIGAGSIVSKDIPENQIWAGNPIKYIKDID